MPEILKLKKYATGAMLVVATIGLAGCYAGPGYGPRQYGDVVPVYSAPAYGYYHSQGPAYYNYSYNYSSNYGSGHADEHGGHNRGHPHNDGRGHDSGNGNDHHRGRHW
jgi:hypothetical protein